MKNTFTMKGYNREIQEKEGNEVGGLKREEARQVKIKKESDNEFRFISTY